MDPGILIENAIGKTGCYQIFITIMIIMSRFSVFQHQMTVLLVSPPVGNFTCIDTSLSECDQKCPGHKFDHSVWENTIDYEFDLVCNRAYLKSVVQSLVMLGILLGSVCFGYLADRFGRHGPLIFAIILLVSSGTATAFSPWLWLYITLKVLSTFGLAGTMFPTYSILLEFTDKKYRTLVVGMLLSIPVSIGHALLGPIGYYIRRWDHIQLAISVPYAALLIYWCFLPESPRWLLAVGKGERVIKILERGAKCNKLPIDHIRPEVEEYLNQRKDIEEKQGGNIKDLFRTKRMATKTLIMFLSWAIVSMNYFGVAQYIGQISGNIFLNIAISGLIQIPGAIIGSFLLDVIGRKWSVILGFTLVFVPMYIIALIPKTPVWPTQAMACIGMMGSTMSFAMLYVYAGELFPTLVRSLGMGMSSMFARMGSMISPFVMPLVYWVPPLIFATLALIAALCIFFFLPETKGHDLPATVEDADLI